MKIHYRIFYTKWKKRNDLLCENLVEQRELYNCTDINI